jgi:hypothetical protein
MSLAMFSSRIRLISRTAASFEKRVWPAGTIFSDSAPAKCELLYATTPSELRVPPSSAMWYREKNHAIDTGLMTKEKIP